MKLFSLIFSVFFSLSVQAALPPPFSDCLVETTGATMTVYDLKELAKLSKVTVCQGGKSLIGKYETIDLLKTANVNLGISLAKTDYTKDDLLDLAKSGKYLLYVDGNRLLKENLIELSKAGVQLAIMSETSGLSKADLLAIAKEKPFVYNVNSNILKETLIELVNEGVQLVIRTNQSTLSKYDILAVVKVDANLVTVLP